MPRPRSTRFSFGDLVFFGISSILGAGLFLSSAKAYHVGSYHVIWIVVVVSVLATIMALAFAEMGGRFTKTGGVYLYAREAFGKGFAFNIGLLRFIVLAVGLATESSAIPTILSDFSDVFKQTFWSVLIAAIFLLILFMINLQGVSSNAKMAKIIEIIVLSTVFVFIITSLFHIHRSNFVSTLPLNPDGTRSHLTFPIFSDTFILMFYAFLGFENIGTGAKDIQNPTKNIPRAIIVTMLILGILYFFIYFGIVGVLGPKLLDVNSAIGFAAASYMGKWAAVFISIVCIIAISGIGLSQMFSGARSFAPMAEDGFFSDVLARPNKRGVPLWSLIIITVLAFAFVFVGKVISTDAFVLLLSCTTIGRLIQYIAVSIGILVLRKKDGNSKGYHMRGAPVFVPLVVLLCLGFILASSAAGLWSISALILFCILVYVFYSRGREKRKKPRSA